jgi:hypothetical protein
MTTLKYVALIAGGVIILGLIWFFFVQDRDKSVEQGSETENVVGSEEEARLEADAYPLYDGVEWGEVQKLEGGLTRVASEPMVDTTNITGVAMPFTEYYHDKLISAGWEQDMMREASGPGANMSYYAKDGRFIVVSFESEFKVKHADAPSECPCDVTLSVTSGQVN